MEALALGHITAGEACHFLQLQEPDIGALWNNWEFGWISIKRNYNRIQNIQLEEEKER